LQHTQRRFDTQAAPGLSESTSPSLADVFEVRMPIRFASLAFSEALRDEMRAARDHTLAGSAGSAEWLEPLIVLAAGSRERAHLARGSVFARRWFAQTVADHLERCETTGLGDRLRRSRLLGLANRLAA
jgi:hypothetical protein